MTHMLVVVRTPDEGLAAVAGGADRLVLTSAPAQDLARVAAAVGERCPVSLRITGPVPDLERLCEACGADEVHGPVTAFADAPERPRRLARIPVNGAALDRSALAGFAGVVLETDQHRERLLERQTPATLQRSVETTRAAGLTVTMAGRIEPPDVPRLLAFAPDALLFDDLGRQGGVEAGALDAERLALLRDLVPRSGRRTAIALRPTAHDRLVVRDWTVRMPIGAYSHEGTQRVSFTVEAELAPTGGPAADMRDVVSYDLITDAIARATVAHVAFVETLAEDVARAVLAHPRVMTLDITVEKLDIGPGRVGCRLRRARDRKG